MKLNVLISRGPGTEQIYKLPIIVYNKLPRAGNGTQKTAEIDAQRPASGSN